LELSDVRCDQGRSGISDWKKINCRRNEIFVWFLYWKITRKVRWVKFQWIEREDYAVSETKFQTWLLRSAEKVKKKIKNSNKQNETIATVTGNSRSFESITNLKGKILLTNLVGINWMCCESLSESAEFEPRHNQRKISSEITIFSILRAPEIRIVLTEHENSENSGWNNYHRRWTRWKPKCSWICLRASFVEAWKRNPRNFQWNESN
jgi:hypothetical protein